MSTPAISTRARVAVRERLVGWTLAEIRDLFESEGFTPTPLDRELGGQRRTLAAEFLAGVDWEADGHRRRFLRVVERLIDSSEQLEGYEPDSDAVLTLLVRDGYTRAPDGTLTARTDTILLDLPQSELSDPSALRLELDRLARDWDHDAGQVITAATRLVEATCKRILSDRDAHGDLGAAPTLPALMKATQEALQLHPRQVDGEQWGDAVEAAARRVLGGLTSITDGLAHLRNTSAGHGQATARTLPPRWGHLAAGAALTVCRMLLETHTERPAPSAPAATPRTGTR